MLKETTTFETWEMERTHRISLSLHEIEQLLYALDRDPDYPNVDGRYQSIGNRLNRLRRKMIDKHRL